MGSGKGNVDTGRQGVAGKVLFEIEGMSEEIAREAFGLRRPSFPCHAFVKRQVRTEGTTMEAKICARKAPNDLGEDLLKFAGTIHLSMEERRASGEAGSFARSAEHCAREDGAAQVSAAR